jgi:hypothetical protein
MNMKPSATTAISWRFKDKPDERMYQEAKS